MQVVGITRVEDYIERLQKDVDELNLLFRDLLISVTTFFRDAEAFESLTQLARAFETATGERRGFRGGGNQWR